VPKYRYQAIDAAGKRLSGVMEAASSTAVADRMHRLRVVLLRADEVGRGPDFFSFLQADTGLKRGLTNAAVASFTRELSVMLRAGQDIDRSLRFLVETGGSRRTRQVLERLRDQVRGGKSLAAGLADQPLVFSRLYISLVRAGEAGGKLADALAHLADLLEREAKLKASIQSALIYPTLLGVVAAGTILLLLTYVLPQFEPIFAQAGAQLPMATRILIAIGRVVREEGTAMLAALLGLGLLGYRALREKRVRLAAEQLQLSVPFVGALTRRAQAARLTRTLGTLLRDGVGLVTALGICREVLTNLTAAGIVETAVAKVRAGERLASAFGQGGFFPLQTIHLIQLGEETGKLAEMAIRAADIHDEQVAHSVERMVALLVPLVTILMGLVVAGIVGSLLTAMLSLNDLAL
jgi:general secretion pathway protein F